MEKEEFTTSGVDPYSEPYIRIRIHNTGLPADWSNVVMVFILPVSINILIL
jgi:hypothetical protein